MASIMGRQTVSLAQMQKQFRVSVPNATEAIYQPLYDYQAYAQAGQTSLVFFQVPQGQSSKTIADTNMELAGTLPQGKKFLVQAIEVAFFPGVATGTLTVPTAPAFVQDVYAFAKSGHLQFFIGSKPYLDEAPIGVFGQTFGLEGFAALADSSTAGATGNETIQYAKLASSVYQITPVTLDSQRNFKITMDWPSAVSISAAARVGVRLLGTMYRDAQ